MGKQIESRGESTRLNGPSWNGELRQRTAELRHRFFTSSDETRHAWVTARCSCRSQELPCKAPESRIRLCLPAGPTAPPEGPQRTQRPQATLGGTDTASLG